MCISLCYVLTVLWKIRRYARIFLHYTDPVLASESCFFCTVRPGAGLPGWRLSAGCTFRMETPAVRGATCLPCATSEQHLRWPFLRAAGPRTWKELTFSLRDNWAITDYFQQTSENIPVLRRILRPRRICDIYDLFAPCINLLTYTLCSKNSERHASVWCSLGISLAIWTIFITWGLRCSLLASHIPGVA